jgi:hypothetical protein
LRDLAGRKKLTKNGGFFIRWVTGEKGDLLRQFFARSQQRRLNDLPRKI